MSRQIDMDKPLSSKDRDYLLERGQGYLVEQLDRVAEQNRLAKEAVQRTVGTVDDPDGRPDFTGEQNVEQNAPGEDDGDPDVYESWKVPELKQELERRELATSGTKAELISRLEDDDDADNSGQ